jgi:uncharacterized protein DUF3658/uncharacterized protein DUF1835
MVTPSLHVVFAPSAAVDLRRALAEAGRTDRVVCPFDNYGFGPIHPPDADARRRWVEDELGCAGWEDVIGQTDAFWRESLSAPDRKVAWFSRRSAQEYSGFLEWLWRLGDLPCQVVDLTDVTVVGRSQDGKPTPPTPATSVALLHWYQILDNGLLNRAESLSSGARQQYVDLWRRLRAENAPLRVLGTDGLASAPISYFDSLLLSYATREWQKTALVVGKSLASFLDNSLLQTGDLVLAARVRALSAAGLLESQGNLFNLRRSEVRLAAGA